MKKAKTISDSEIFFYFLNENKYTIIYGRKKLAVNKKLTLEILGQLLLHFSEKEISIGARGDKPPNNSLGQWIKSKIRINLASYVAPILVKEGYAEVIDTHTIRIL